MTRVSVSGYYGFQNTGDNAILASLVKTLKNISGDIKITVFSATPEKTAPAYGVRSLDRKKPTVIIRELLGTDLLISGGGSLLQDVTSARSIIYYLGIIALAKIFGKPVFLFAHGIGPINLPRNRFLTRLILNRVNMITVRDRDSAEELKKLKINKPPVYITADPAFLLEPADDARIREIFDKEKIISSEGPLIAVSVRPWRNHDDYKRVLAGVCDYLSKEYKAGIIFLPMHWPYDFDTSREIVSLMKEKAQIISRPYSPEEVIGLIKKTKLLIGMRLHALIFSSMAGTPFVGISYDPKICRFIQEMGDESNNPVECLVPEDIKDQCRELINRDDTFLREMDKKVQEMKKRALNNVSYLEEFLTKLFHLEGIDGDKIE